MKTQNISLLFALSSCLAHANDSSRLDRVERDISELSFIVRQLSAKIEKGFSTPSQTKPEIPAKPTNPTHLVRTGDTYWCIARKYGVSVSALGKANPRISAKRLPIGKHINLPGPSSSNLASSTPPVFSRTSYTVKKGDTLGHIALRHEISLKQLVSSNPKFDPRRMQIGKILSIPSKRSPVKQPIESAPPSRPVESNEELPLPPDPEPLSTPPVLAPDPEIPPIAVEEGTASLSFAKNREETKKPVEPESNLLEPETTELIVIDENSRLTDIAHRFLTDVATLNRLNNIELAPDQMIKSGSQIYIPRD
ncbi:MAG: LysM peptidoglycan-binding domain-containing protein [Akkermansiaceae bacterium]|nr:LysM peptidoglycan-binding domain-containing protein [Akkermansiaceae bacterium]